MRQALEAVLHPRSTGAAITPETLPPIELGCDVTAVELLGELRRAGILVTA